MKIIVCMICLLLCFCLIGTSIAPRWYGARKLNALPFWNRATAAINKGLIKVGGVHVFFALDTREKLELAPETTASF